MAFETDAFASELGSVCGFFETGGWSDFVDAAVAELFAVSGPFGRTFRILHPRLAVGAQAPESRL